MILRRQLPHILLMALATEAIAPERLRAHGRQFGKAHAVNVAIDRLREAGLIEVKVELTPRGRFYLKRTEVA